MCITATGIFKGSWIDMLYRYVCICDWILKNSKSILITNNIQFNISQELTYLVASTQLFINVYFSLPTTQWIVIAKLPTISPIPQVLLGRKA